MSVGSSRTTWRHATGVIDCTRGQLVGIVNATPDSFTDEGAHYGVERAVAHGLRLARQGASVVEVGGESLRFSAHTPVGEEIARVVPVITALVAQLDVPVAIDTFKAPVAAAAIAAGAVILNDPTGLRDEAMLQVAAKSSVGVVLTHFFGPPKIRPTTFPDVDVPATVIAWAQEAIATASAAGIDPERIVIDPGVGLGKSPEQDLDLLHRLAEFQVLGRPIFVPISNKKVIGAVTGALPKQRLAGTTAAMAWCRSQGATIFRVHNVKFLARALAMSDALADGVTPKWYDVAK
jgi:dihydropteroate synthase